MKYGVNINSIDDFGNTPLIIAAREGRVTSCETALSYGVEINARNNDGQTALTVAIMNNKFDNAKFLIGKGAQT